MPAKKGQRSTSHKRPVAKRASHPRRAKPAAAPVTRRGKANGRPAPRPVVEEAPTFLEVTPSLAVRDVARSLVFYRRLGFRPTAQLPPTGRPEWLRLERDRVAILIWNEVIAPPDTLAAIAQARGAGNSVRIAVPDADKLARELEENGVALRRAPESMPEGVRELSVTDPDGFVIEFAARLATRGTAGG